MPILLYTYLAAEILGPFFGSLLIINAILFLGKLSSLLEIIFSLGITPSDFGRISIYLLPNLLLFSIPMASTLGVIIAFTRLAGDNEILALKASGTGLYRLLVPVLMVAIFSSGLTALSAWLLIPNSNVALKKTLYQLTREKIDKGLQAREFSDSLQDVVIYVDKVDSATNTWQGVYISDRRSPRNPLTILARSGNLKARLDEMEIILELQQGNIHRNHDDTSQTITFNNYRLELPVNFDTTGFKKTPSPAQVHKNDLTPSQLLLQAAELRQEAERSINLQDFYKGMSVSMIIEFHKRLALPVGCLILTLLALPLALQSRPGQRQVGLPLGLFFFILYYILLTVAKSTAETSGLPVGPLMWSPNLFMAALTLLMIRSSARENTVKYLERLVDMVYGLLSFFRKNPQRVDNDPA